MVSKEYVKKLFNEEYNRLYDAEEPVAGEHEAMELFDRLNESSDDIISVMFHGASNAMFKIRNDICSSDRECSAFIFTALSIGFAEIMRVKFNAEQDD